MSINTDPKFNIYAPPQAPPDICYELDEVPEWQYLCMAGVRKGQAAAPGDPPPPNTVQIIALVDTTKWVIKRAGIDYNFEPQPGNALVFVRIAGGADIFRGVSGAPCTRWFANIYQDPVNDDYYGGWVLVTHAADDITPSELVMMGEINMAAEDGTYSTPRPKTGIEAIHTLSRRFDATNIKILYDHS